MSGKSLDAIVNGLRDRCLDELQKLKPSDRRTAADDLLRELQEEVERLADEADEESEPCVIDCGNCDEEDD
jgi:hypothetical protein